MPDDEHRVHRMRVDRQASLASVPRRSSGSMTKSVPGASPRGHASTRIVDVGRVHQRIGEIEAANAEVDDAHAGGSSRASRRCATSTPKPSSPRKMLPMPAIRIDCGDGAPAPAAADRDGRILAGAALDFLWRVEEAMPGLAQQAEIAARVVVEHDAPGEYTPS